eukprot:1452359-Pyramimonas_sp.AAC.1
MYRSSGFEQEVCMEVGRDARGSLCSADSIIRTRKWTCAEMHIPRELSLRDCAALHPLGPPLVAPAHTSNA